MSMSGRALALRFAAERKSAGLVRRGLIFLLFSRKKVSIPYLIASGERLFRYGRTRVGGERPRLKKIFAKYDIALWKASSFVTD